MSVNPILLKAVVESTKGLSGGKPVLYYNTYQHSYNPADLPPLKDKKALYQTLCLSELKSHYINFALRAATAGLLSATNIGTKNQTRFVTLQFNKEFSEKIIKSIRGKSPAAYFGQCFRKRIASKLDISDYYYVLERSKSNNLHVHLVLNFDINKDAEFKELIKNTNWLNLNKHGKIAESSMHIASTYKVEVLKRAMSKNDAELMELEIESSIDTLWEYDKTRFSTCGKLIWVSCKLKEPHPIDVGLADYLSKNITKKLFEKGKNYGFSRNIKSLMEPFIQQLFDECKKAKS